MPVTITGPATENILTHMPNIQPSFLNSIAGDAIELEKPVIGTMDPAPAKAPMRSYTPKPVKNDAKKISITEVYTLAVSRGILSNIAIRLSVIPCPIQQISPPTKKAYKSDGKGFVCGSLFST